MLSSQHLVETLDTRPFDPAELVDGTTLGSGLAESHIVHLTNYFETDIRIERKPRLMKKSVRPSAPRLARGVEADAGLANPHQKTTNSRRERNGRMGDTGARLQHQTRESSYRDMRAHAISVDHDEGAVQDIETSLLDKQDGGAILDRNGVGRHDSRRRRHGDQNLRVSAQRLRPRAAGLPNERFIQKTRTSAPSSLFVRALLTALVHVAGKASPAKSCPMPAGVGSHRRVIASALGQARRISMRPQP